MKKYLTQRETRAIGRVKRALDALPATLRVYVVDSPVTVCKLGAPCYDVGEVVGAAQPTVSLEYLHDEQDYGRGELKRTGTVSYMIACVFCGVKAQQVGIDLPAGWTWDHGGDDPPNYCCPACSPPGAST